MIKQFDFETFSSLLVKENAYKKYASFIKRDWMLVDKNTCVADITAFIDKYGVVLVKPNSGEQGGGIFKASKDDLSRIQSLLEYNELLLEQVVVNCSEISRINPSSLNTFRVYTLIDRNGIPRILAIMLRAGAAGKAVDNWGSGGVGYSFDVDSGVCVGYGYDKKHNRYIFHPGSEFIMAGFSIPQYKEFTEFVLALAKVELRARYVGWDIAITPDGFELIEMNFPGGHDFLQAFGVPAYPLIQKYW